MYDELLILAGAFAGGYVSGLTGFGTGLTALPFWLNVVHPVVAAPLVVICSVVAQVQTLPAIWHAVDRRRAAPFVVGGLVGVPLGTLLLSLQEVRHWGRKRPLGFAVQSSLPGRRDNVEQAGISTPFRDPGSVAASTKIPAGNDKRWFAPRGSANACRLSTAPVSERRRD